MRLYIQIAEGWKELVLSQSEAVRINSSWDNIDNPMTMTSDNTYTIKLPRCKENELVFNNFYKVDSLRIPTVYDPAKRMNCMIMSDLNEIISDGEAYITSATKEYFSLNYTGALSKILSKIKNSGFDKTKVGEQGYTLLDDPIEDLGLYMCADLVKHSWSVQKPIDWESARNTTDFSSIYGISDAIRQSYKNKWLKATSIIGFTPMAQGRYRKFESDKWYTRQEIVGKNANGVSIKDKPFAKYTMNAITATEVFSDGTTGHNDGKDAYNLYLKHSLNDAYETTIDVGEGFLDCQMNEYRSYYQQPFVNVNALFYEVARQSETKYGTKVILDEDLFSTGGNDVYLLPQIFRADDKVDVIEYSNLGSFEDNMVTYGNAHYYWNCPTKTFRDANQQPMNVKHVGRSEYVESHIGFITEFELEGEIHFDLQQFSERTPYWFFYSMWNPILIEIDVEEDGNNNLVNHFTKRLCIFPNFRYYSLGYETTVDSLVNYGNVDDSFTERLINDLKVSGYETLTVEMDMATPQSRNFTIPWKTKYRFNPYTSIDKLNNKVNPRVRVKTQTSFYNNMLPIFDVTSQGSIELTQDATFKMGNNIVYKGGEYECKRTGRHIDMNTLLGGTNVFDILLAYSKMKHFLWVPNDKDNTMTVIRSKKYFDEKKNHIQNITDCIDWNGAELQPLSFNYEAIKFNFTDPFNGYEERYGMPQGSMKVVTENHLTKNENEIYGLSKAPILYGQIMRPIKYYNIAPIEDHAMPLGKDDTDGESTDRWGVFLKEGNKGDWNRDFERDYVVGKLYGYAENDQRTLNKTGKVVYCPIITDDLEEELNSDLYAWHGESITTPQNAFAYDTYGAYGTDRLVSNAGLFRYHETQPMEYSYRYASPINNVTANTCRVALSKGDQNELLVFGKSRELYSTEDEETASKTLYNVYWKDYIHEVFSIDNKHLTATAYLNIIRYNELKNNPFCEVDDRLYFCYSIEGWSETDNKCKLYLRQINDLEDYTKATEPYATLDYDCVNI